MLKATLLSVTLLFVIAAAADLRRGLKNNACCSCMTTFKDKECDITAKPGKVVEVKCTPLKNDCTGPNVAQDYQ